MPSSNVIAFRSLLMTYLSKSKLKLCSSLLTTKSFDRSFAAFHDGENDFIAMEDLTVAGFRTFDRQLGVDANHCRLALASLGRFHGVSHAMRTLEPDAFAQIAGPLKDHYYAETARSWFEGMAELEISVTRAALKEECPGSEIERKMHEFTDSTQNFYSRMIDKTHNFDHNFGIIGHGDCWLPNFLFSYSKATGLPEAVKMIDFQLARHCSSALDILFFIYSCTTQELRDQHYEDMIQWYYDGVVQMLQQFELDAQRIIPRQVLNDELRHFGKYGVGVAMEAVPLTIMDDADTTDMEAIQGDEPMTLPEIWRLKPIRTHEGRRRLVDVFSHALKQGFL